MVTSRTQMDRERENAALCGLFGGLVSRGGLEIRDKTKHPHRFAIDRGCFCYSQASSLVLVLALLLIVILA